MRNHLALPVATLLLATANGLPVAAQQTLAEEVLEGCGSELEAYCQTVTPGEGRLLVCLYAHEDHLSGRCQFALYDAAVRLERAAAALTYAASECRAEIEALCADVEMGEGRIAQCLQDHEAELGAGRAQARSDLGLND